MIPPSVGRGKTIGTLPDIPARWHTLFQPGKDYLRITCVPR
jgi:hypothetical protein